VATGLLEEIQARAVVVVGIAGGLSPDLAVGMVVVADRLSDAAGEVPAPDSSLIARAAALAGARRGTIHSHTEIAIDPVAKSRLWSRVGRVMPAAVDLESASYARAAAARGVPYLVLRAISDGYDEALPLDFNRYRKPDGSSDRARVLRYTLRHPSIVPELMQLRERMRHCAGRLAALVEKVVVA
jgi:adenosylhomocysteine nucleosidase